MACWGAVGNSEGSPGFDQVAERSPVASPEEQQCQEAAPFPEEPLLQVPYREGELKKVKKKSH